MITVCIPTIPRREVSLFRLLAVLEPQLKEYGLPDPFIYSTPRTDAGGPSIGAKRNYMIGEVQTPYVTFIDDDDLISAAYIRHVMNMIEANVDGMGFRGLMTTDGTRPCEFVHSHRYNWIEKPAVKDGVNIYIRPLNHLNPIRTDIARAIGYEDMRHGEDHNYAIRLKQSGLVRTEYFADDFVYNYIYKSRK